MKRRVFSFVTALALCLNLCPLWAFAAEVDPQDNTGLCPHHLAHTDECGYKAPTEGSPCAHKHDENCGYAEAASEVPCDKGCTDTDGDGVIDHVGGCAYTPAVEGSPCTHVHDESCAYVAADPGKPCTFVCRICPINALIKKLPDSATEDNAEQTGKQLDEILALYKKLSGAEQAQVDLSRCVVLRDQLEKLNGESSQDRSLNSDATDSTPFIVEKTQKLYLNGHTLTNNETAAVQVKALGVLEIIGPGTIVSKKGSGVVVETGGRLTISEDVSVTSNAEYALDIAKGEDVKLSAGTYHGCFGAIRVQDGNYAAVLENGSAFYDGGSAVLPENLGDASPLTVGQCTGHKKTYTHNPGAPTHKWACQYCGAGETEKCTFSFNENGAGDCALCRNKLAINVDQDALSNLVYDGTTKPTDVPVTVTLTDPDGNSTTLVRSTEGTQDRDFTVDIVSIKDAGEATVTVNGVIFNGTFVKTYTVERDKPGLSWANSNPVTLNYDGAPVEAGDLPDVNINIQSQVDNLQGYLQYSHKKQDETDYTDGLPKDAGTYDVIVSLPVLPNFEGAVSSPITLTINKIAPIVTTPAAKTLTYNRTAQALVTAGTLNPVAIADGLKIQFATEQNGTYSDTIPTGTSAGDYTVWYQVVGLTGNYIAPDPNPAQVTGVEIQRKHITPVVTLSQYSYLYDSGYHEPTVTVIDDEDGHYVINPLDNEYTVEYVNNRNVSTDANPAKVVVTDSDPDGGNYDLDPVTVEFKITSKTQDTLSITNKPATFTYGDKFTLQTSGGSGNGLVTWEIVPADPDNPTAVAATVDATSGQVTITGHGSVTVKATKSGKDPATNVVNYEDATATWTFTADKKPVTATVTAEDKTYDGDKTATVNAVVEGGILPGDEIKIEGLTGTFDDENAGENKTVTVVTTGAKITGTNSEHYDVSYSATTVKATIHKAVAKITTAPAPANLTYDGTAQALIGTAAVVDPNSVQVEYALSKDGTYSTDFPKGTNAGTYTVWYRVQETDNYTGLAPESVGVTIAKKPVSPTITLDQDTFIYDGTTKEPVVTLKEADGTTIIPVGEYTVAYSNNVNVSTADTPATVTVTAKDDGNYSFTSVTKNFTINKQQATVVEAPEAAGLPLTFNTFAQRLVTAGEASGGTMVYRVGDTGDFKSNIPTEINAAEYTVYYKVQGDSNHSDSAVGSLKVTIAPKTVKDPTIELYQDDGTTTLVSYTYDGSAKKPKAVVKDGSTVIADTEYNIVYSDNTDAGHGTVNITANPGGNYTVTGSATFVINKADIVDPEPQPADLTYDGTAQELLVPGTTTGGTVLYALNSATSTYLDAIPTATEAGTYNVYYKVTGDKNHNDLAVQGPVAVTIQRKPLTDITIELEPNSFQYDSAVHLPTVTVKDGDTVLPASEYSWTCNVPSPTQGGTYTITVSDKAGGNYDLTGAATANKNTATFTIGKAAQAELVIEGKPAVTNYGDAFTLTTSGGSSTGGLTWVAVGGNASVDENGNVKITGVGEVTISVVKAGDTNYEQTSTQWTFTAAPKPVTASVTVQSRDYDGTTAATVASAGITTINSDTVKIDPTSIKATFDDPHAGTGKTVTLDTSKVQVTGDTAKYAISYPDTVTAEITKATTMITTAPEKIDPLTYNEQPQALITAGQTNVGFLEYALSAAGPWSTQIPSGTNAGDYTVYYKVDETADYTGVTGGPINVAIAPKDIKDTVKIELSETSYVYDSAKKSPKVTLKDGDTVIPESQYEVTWANDNPAITEGLLTAVGAYSATITNVTGGNYIIDNTAEVHITPATQASLHITGQPENVYYGDTVTTLNTTGGTGEGTVTWSVTAGGDIASFDANTNVLKITGVGAVTVRAERTVPNYGTAADSWTFTVEPKPVTAAVTITAKTYDGTTTVADTDITVAVKASDLVGSDVVKFTGLTATYADANAGTGKAVTVDTTHAAVDEANSTHADWYDVTIPTAATGDITPKDVSVTVTLSDHDLKPDISVTPTVYYYEYDGTEKKPSVTVTADGGAVLKDSDYSVSIVDNKNVGDATVTVTAKEGGNYTFTAKTENFEIRKAAAVLTSSPQAKDLTYNGTEQELVGVGVASGGTVVYSATGADDSYSEAIPTGENADTYTVYYKVKGDGNHTDTEPKQVTVTIKPREITPAITLSADWLTNTNGVYTCTYDGTAKTPTVTVKDGTETIDATEYTVSYRDNTDVGTATVTVSDANGGNYTVNGTATFQITKKAPTVTAPTGKTGLQYTAGPQDLLEKLGVADGGTVVYSLDGVNYAPTMPTATAVATHTVYWKVLGDANHSDIAPATLTVNIAKNTVTNPTITLSSAQFTYDGNQHRPEVTVTGNNGQLIDPREYTVSITPGDPNNTSNLVDVDTYTVTVAAAASSNYEFTGTLTREFKIIPANQETISITGTKTEVRYGDTIQLGTTGGVGGSTVTWKIEGATGTTLTQGGLLTVKDVNTSITVTVTRSRDNYDDVSDTWEFTATKKPVTADVTVAPKNYDGNTNVATEKITATVKAADLAFTDDSITITGLTGTYDSASVGTGKTVTLSGGTVGGTNADKYDVTIPATATASILAVAATVDTVPGDVTPTLTYDAAQAQTLVTPGTATGGTMVYSLDGGAFSPDIPKAKDAGTYTIKYKVQGDRNHTDSAVGSVDVTIGKQTVTPQIELSPPSGQYDGKVQQPKVTVRDTANNVIPESEYKVTYVSDGGANWKDQGAYTVKVENITGGNYVVETKTADFVISTTAQAPLEIVNKPGLVTYGDTFTLSTSGGSGSEKVTWSVDPAGIVEIDANGFVKVVGVGSATIKATKPGGGNYDTATATYPLNALQKPVTATVTADDKVYDGNTNATIHITWSGLVGNDTIDTSGLAGAFEDANVGTNKKVTITGTPTADATAQKYDITIPSATTASITRADATAPTVTGNTLTYTGSAQALVSGGDASTLYSTTRDGVYTGTVPTGTNARTYTVWYKTKGDANHTDSAPQGVTVTISAKALNVAAASVELTGNGLQTDGNGYYYEYDGAEKTPAVVIKDGSEPISTGEYTVTYTNNRDAGDATVTITDKAGGNYTVTVDGTVSFTIKSVAAILTGAPQDRGLTYRKDTAQELVTVGTATGGHIEYKLTSAPTGESAPSGTFSTNIPTGTRAGAYTVDYKVVGDGSYSDGPSGTVAVTIAPKTVISPKITVNPAADGKPFTYTGSALEPTVTVMDGADTIGTGEYTLSYRDNVNAGTASVVVSDNSGGNYTVNGTAEFTIGKAEAKVDTPPEFESDAGKLAYTGEPLALLKTAGTATGGTLVYALSETGTYSAAIPTGKAVGKYKVWYMVQGDANHNSTEAKELTGEVEITRRTVTDPLIQVTPESVTYNGLRQTPTVTVKVDGVTLNGSEYNVTYTDTVGNTVTELKDTGTYTVTITGVTGGNYTFDTTDGKNTATYTILPADQTPLTITGTRERVYYGDAFPLGTNGSSGGTVKWSSSDTAVAAINEDTGRLTITGVGDVTVTATCKRTGYNDQIATWPFHADQKPVTATVTADNEEYNGDTAANVTATLQDGDFVGTDSFTITLTGCTFEDANAGENKTVTVVSTNPSFTVNAGGTDNHENYSITYPATVTASITKADIPTDKVIAPTAEAAANLVYTGQPLALVTAGSVDTGYGTLEYSTDGTNYAPDLPTGTDAKGYEVWYRVKGDGNHNDVDGKKLGSVTITAQTVTPIIEFTPNQATYNGQEQKPSVTVKDAAGRVIPDTEYTVAFSDTGWTAVSVANTMEHTVTVTDKAGGNYTITETAKEFTILPAGQDPLSIMNQPGTVYYGTDFTLSVTGGSGAGTVSWSSDKTGIASIDQNGKVTVHQAGGPVTITATRTAAGHTAATATWTFSAEKKPVTAIITASDKVYSGDAAATLTIDWNPGDVLTADVTALTNNLANALTGTFGSAGVGDNKTVTIALKTGFELPDGGSKYAVSFNRTTTASITPAASSVTPPIPVNPEYNGRLQDLVTPGSATNGTIQYSTDGIVYGPAIPQGKDADTYRVWYKVVGSENYKDVDPAVVPAAIQPKTVTSPNIELSPETFEYDGTAKKPDVVVKDGSTVIPASEYTVSYRDNINKGTTATVTITDNDGGNYTVSGSRTFTITAAAVKLTTPPEPLDQTYTGKPLRLVSAGVAENGTVMYSLDGGEYGTAIPRATDAGNYEIGYKVVDADGKTVIPENFFYVTIAPKEVTPTIKLAGSSSYSVAYDGQAKEPAVTVYVGTKQCSEGTYTVEYANNTNAGTAEVTVQSAEDSNYEFLAFKTFTITKAKESFNPAPAAKQNLRYNGTAQPLVTQGTGKYGGIVVYSLDNGPYSTAIPTAINRGDYTVYAKVQGSGNYEESDVVSIPVTIGVNTVSADDLTITLPGSNFPYTGGEIRPTVTVRDHDGNVIDSSEYTVTYSNNIAVGTATIDIKSKLSGNYSFTKTVTFNITDGSQAPLTITGKRDTVTYGDSFTLGVTGGGSGTVTWNSSNTDVATITSGGTLSVEKAGSVTITATRDGKSAEWQFYAYPRQITALVTVADKEFDGTNTIDPNRLTITLSGVLPGHNVSLTATGQFIDEKAGTSKTVFITLSGLEAIKDQYEVSYNQTATASITPKAASVTAGAVTGNTNLTYSGDAQALVTVDSSKVEGGNLAYSLDGNTYTLSIPTATEVGSYPVWYKVVAGDENHKDSAPVQVTPTPQITANPNGPGSVQCSPGSLPYDGTVKTPEVVVLDSTGTHIIPASEYTVSFSPSLVRDVGKYSVTVTDKPGGNYDFTAPVTVANAFEIVASSQAPVSITDKPASVHYGGTFYLSATGGTGGGKIVWNIESTGTAPAEITQDGAVTVTDVGTFTVKAYRAASGGYSVSNTDTVTFTAQPKVVTPVVTAEDKTYDSKTDAKLTATVRPSDLVNSGDKVDLTVTGAFASPDAGTGKRVDLGTCTVAGAAKDKYTINWPDYVMATINRANATITVQPGALNPVANGADQNLVSPGTADMGTIVYSLDQNGVYSDAIPQASAPGNYRVWYKIADNANYTVQAPAYVDVVIAAGSNTVDTGSDSSTNSLPVRAPQQTPSSTETTVQNGTATTVVSAAAGNQLVRQAAANQSDSIVIKPEIAEGETVTKTAVSIPASTASQLNSQTNAALTVSAPIADVTIPNAALDTLGSAGGTVDVVTEQVGDAVKLTLSAGGETVESVPGGVTLTVPVEDATPGTVAVLVGEDGTRQVIQKSVAKDGAVSVPLDGSATVEIVDNSKTFEDISSEDWESDAVAFASARELFVGTGGDSFEPETQMSRSMLAEVLYRLEGSPAVEDSASGDDSGSKPWYADSAAWATEKGITDSGFDPNEAVTREQFALMLWRYAGKPQTGEENADQTGSDAQKALLWATEKGVLIGRSTEEQQIDPEDPVTRAEAVQMVKNFLEKS